MNTLSEYSANQGRKLNGYEGAYLHEKDTIVGGTM